MDFVSKRHRGLYNSLEMFAWGLLGNGSSIIGGYIVEKSGYDTCFRVTALIYFVASLPSIAMIGMVPSETSSATKTIDKVDSNDGIDGKASLSSSSLLQNDALAQLESQLDEDTIINEVA
jgi:MFS family permease